MNGGENRARSLGVISCCAAVLGGVIFLVLASSREAHLILIGVLFGMAVLGLASGIAGLLASRGQGRLPVLSIIGCLLNVPSAYVGLMVLAVIFGQGH